MKCSRWGASPGIGVSIVLQRAAEANLKISPIVWTAVFSVSDDHDTHSKLSLEIQPPPRSSLQIGCGTGTRSHWDILPTIDGAVCYEITEYCGLCGNSFSCQIFWKGQINLMIVLISLHCIHFPFKNSFTFQWKRPYDYLHNATTILIWMLQSCIILWKAERAKSLLTELVKFDWLWR